MRRLVLVVICLMMFAPRAAISIEFYGPVQAADTLWSLAARFRPDHSVSVQRMMLALLKANPEAFEIGNVNALRAGATLRIPTREEIGPDDETAALAAVQRQHQVWAQYRQGRHGVPSSTVPASSEAVEAPAAAAPAGEASTPEPAGTEAASGDVVAPPEERRDVASPAAAPRGAAGITPEAGVEFRALHEEMVLAIEALKSRLVEAEHRIEALKRLVEARSSEVATLQAALRVPVEAEPMPEPAPAEAEPMPEPAPVEAEPMPEPAPAEAEPMPEPAPVEAEPMPEPAPAEAEPMPEPAPVEAEPMPEPAPAEAEPMPEPAPVEAEPMPEPAPVEAEPMPEPAPVEAEPMPEPAPVEAEPMPEPAPVEAEPMPEPAPVEAEPMPEPAPVEAEPMPEPAPAEAEPMPEPAPVEAEPMPEPAPVEAEPMPEPAPVEAEPMPEPAPVEAEPMPEPAPVEAEPMPEPAPVEAEPMPEPAPVEAEPMPEPAPVEAEPMPEPAPVEAEPMPEPAPVEAEPMPEPAPVEAEPMPEPAPVEAEPMPEPAPVEAEPMPEPAPVEAEPMPEPAPAPREQVTSMIDRALGVLPINPVIPITGAGLLLVLLGVAALHRRRRTATEALSAEAALSVDEGGPPDAGAEVVAGPSSHPEPDLGPLVDLESEAASSDGRRAGPDHPASAGRARARDERGTEEGFFSEVETERTTGSFDDGAFDLSGDEGADVRADGLRRHADFDLGEPAGEATLPDRVDFGLDEPDREIRGRDAPDEAEDAEFAFDIGDLAPDAADGGEGISDGGPPRTRIREAAAAPDGREPAHSDFDTDGGESAEALAARDPRRPGADETSGPAADPRPAPERAPSLPRDRDSARSASGPRPADDEYGGFALDPPTGDEVQTKLDLAQAYVEMGDSEVARGFLDEVLTEGDASQREIARAMLSKLD